MTPKLSIITPVKDQEKYIRECITSAQEQSFTSWEWVIVDDHSKDKTVEIIQEYQASDSRIKLLKNLETGIVPALQLAFKHSEGEFITRFDGDDMMPEGRLDKMYQAILSSQPKTVVTGRVKYFPEEQVSNGYQAYEKWLNNRVHHQDHWKWIYRECIIASPNWVCRKSDLINIKAFEHLVYPEDYHLVLKWHEHGFNIITIDCITLLWREHPERTSRKSQHYNQRHFFELKIKYITNKYGTENQYVVWGTNEKARLTAKLLMNTGISFLWMSLTDHPPIYDQEILPYTDLEKIDKPKLLLCIYPSENEQESLETYLQSLKLYLGENYWYL